MQTAPNSGGFSATRGVMLAVLSGCSFVQPLSMFILSPLLVDLAREFDVTVAQAGLLVTMTALPSAALALFIGPMADYVGRRPLLLSGLTLLAISSVASALAPNFDLILASRVLAGVGLASMGPSIFAAVGDLFPYSERGRAYAWTIGANTLSSILGVPMATILASAVDWRWSFAAVAAITGAATAVLAVLYRPLNEGAAAGVESRRAALMQSFRNGYGAVFHTPSALAVFGSTFVNAIGLMAFETYLGALLITRYQITTGELAPIVGLAGLGTLIGSQIGGRMGDRWGHKQFMSTTVVVAALFVLVLAYADVSYWVAGALNFVRSGFMGMRFTSASVIISEAVPDARATMQAVNQSAFNAGVVLGSFGGGQVSESFGYSHISLMTLVGALLSATLIIRFVVENRDAEPRVSIEEAEAAVILREPEPV